MKKSLFLLAILVVLIMAGTFVIMKWSWVFSRKVIGEVSAVERIMLPGVVVGNGMTNKEMFSFAVAIKQKDGEIVTGSSEDRQWAVVSKGQCAEATFFPYPIWELGKGQTYFNVRLDRLTDCTNVSK
jgi:hypothetical protein